MVSADLSGIGNASGHPVRWSIIVRMCLLPDVEVSPSVTNQWLFYQMVYLVSQSSVVDTVEL